MRTRQPITNGAPKRSNDYAGSRPIYDRSQKPMAFYRNGKPFDIKMADPNDILSNPDKYEVAVYQWTGMHGEFQQVEVYLSGNKKKARRV